MAIFQKKKPAPGAQSDSPALRGRREDEAPGAANPLARRFIEDDEPDTIDLRGAAGFPAESGPSAGEPDTQALSARAAAEGPGVTARRHAFLTVDPETGKFYLQPGPEGSTVLLGDEPVTAPTELRRGDTIRIGRHEFRFLL